MLVTSIFSFFLSVFQSPLLKGCLKSGLCGKKLTINQTVASFTNPEKKPFEKSVRKGNNAVSQHHLLFPQGSHVAQW